ncbi:hypothetical protein DFR33_101298 [Bradymonas sediminis]|nr:hypothetical protein DFR33_101298 [Bradymonas sediminis]
MMSAGLLLMLSVPGCSDAPAARNGDDADARGDVSSPDALGDVSSPNIHECVITDPNDLPGANILEDNCAKDGATVIFVDPKEGDDARSGETPSQAVKSLAVALVKATGARIYILAAAGTFKERVALKDGVSIFGGYDAADGWARNKNDVLTEIDPSGDASAFDDTTTDYITVVAQDIDKPTTLDRLTIRGVDAVNQGASSYVIWAHNADGLRVRDAIIVAGKGQKGRDGEAGLKGDERSCEAGGGEGADNNDSQAQPDCGAPNGVYGAAAGGTDGSGGISENGEHQASSGGGVGGDGGAHACPRTLAGCSVGVGDGVDGGAGEPGQPGAHGQPGSPAGHVVADGLWRGDWGESATDGENGGGGGGGGAGGICSYNGGKSLGDNGGHGGDGGCGGTLGENGQPGGASFGIFASNSDLSLSAVIVELAEAGGGGNGAKGGDGQEATNQGISVATGRNTGGGRGGDGGFGGDGAPGGDGVGGCGGPSVGIAKYASDFEVAAETSFTQPSEPSKGGAHAMNAGAPARCDGLLADQYEFGN